MAMGGSILRFKIHISSGFRKRKRKRVTAIDESMSARKSVITVDPAGDNEAVQAHCAQNAVLRNSDAEILEGRLKEKGRCRDEELCSAS